jgi:hypothetical protein
MDSSGECGLDGTEPGAAEHRAKAWDNVVSAIVKRSRLLKSRIQVKTGAAMINDLAYLLTEVKAAEEHAHHPKRVYEVFHGYRSARGSHEP